MSSTVKQITLWVVIVGGGILLYFALSGTRVHGTKEIAYNKMVEKIQNDEITKLVVKSSEVIATDRGKQEYRSPLANDFIQADLVKIANEKNSTGKQHVDSVEMESAGSGIVWNLLLTLGAPVILVLVIWVFMMRQMQASGNKALSFGKSRAKLLNNQQKRVTFKDVAGVEEAKDELQEIIEFLKEPQKFQKLGGRIPKGVL
ncbi:MAG: ATP-dependent metallopeptidase FtsH/Yme1/Tma family protein, partial [Pyrinomonadaceae bacterium]